VIFLSRCTFSARGEQPERQKSLLVELIKAVDLETDCAEKLQTLALGNFFRAPQKAKWLWPEKSVFARAVKSLRANNVGGT
jgi:hypothetical protein